MSNAATIKVARNAAGLSAREAAALVGVTTLTWQRWEGQSSRATEIPYAHWNLFLLLVGAHPVFTLSELVRCNYELVTDDDNKNTARAEQ